MNLLEPPHSSQFSTFCRSTWTAREPGETGAPALRIIHGRGVRLPTPARVSRVGLKLGKGYFKCGSDPWSHDWATDVRVLGHDAGGWRTILDVRNVTRPHSAEEMTWFDLGGNELDSAYVQMRRCEVDGWWPSWNLAMSGLALEGSWDAGVPVDPPVQKQLALEECSIGRLPRGVEARVMGGEIRFRTRFLHVGFRLRRASFAFLSFDDEGTGRVEKNLLAFGGFDHYVSMLREHFAHGLRLSPVAGPQAVSYAAHDVEGSARVKGATVDYRVRVGATGQTWRLRWEVREGRLVLDAVREGSGPLRAWESSAWHIPFDSRVTPVSSVGRLRREGETGMLVPPVLLHAPGFCGDSQGAPDRPTPLAEPLFYRGVPRSPPCPARPMDKLSYQYQSFSSTPFRADSAARSFPSVSSVCPVAISTEA